jgi:RNA polymerase-binding protein DksA
LCYVAAPMSAARKKPSKKAAARKKTSARKKTTARKTGARKKTTARKKKTTARRKPAAAKKTAARKTPKKAAGRRKPSKRTTSAKKPSKTTAKKPVARKPIRKPAVTPRPRPAPDAPQPRRRRVRPAKLDAESLRQIERELREERADLRRREEELEKAAFGDTQSDITGEVGLDEDFADAGTATFERERDLSIRNNIRDLIDQIDRALARIADRSYGSCERCGNPIDAARLKALPHALLCMDCKRRDERAR